MDRSDRELPTESSVVQVSDAMVGTREDRTLRGLRKAEIWVLVDAPRWVLIAGLAGVIFVTTMVVALLGPVSVREFLLSGTSAANAYIELQPGIITAITIVLAINQIVLSPEFGALGRQRQRLTDVLSHRRDVEETADVISSPTDPAGFLRTIADATREHAQQLADETADGESQGLRDAVTAYVDGIKREVQPVNDALAAHRFGRIEMLGAAIHYDTTRDIHRARQLRHMYAEELTVAQERALDDLLDSLEEYTIAREYFRTRYLQSQFIRFTRAMLYTGLPALVAAHYAIEIIGPGALPGSTLGVRNLLWFESATFTVTMLPIIVIISYVARIVTIAETSIFISPFSQETLKSSRQ